MKERAPERVEERKGRGGREESVIHPSERKGRSGRCLTIFGL